MNDKIPSPAAKAPKKKPATKAAPLPVPELTDASLKLTVATLLRDMLLSGEFEIEYNEQTIVGAYVKRIEKLEARVAELEKSAGIKTA